jgi:phage-related protein (TIGR01555 family)
MANSRIKKPVLKTQANDNNIGLPKTKKAAKAAAADAAVMDAFRNVPARMGQGTPSLGQAAEYVMERWTNDYWLMLTLFRNHWISRKIVEGPAKDMTKAWPRLQTEMNPKLIQKFDRTIQRTFTPKRIQRAITWARLFGGAGALMVIDGHEDILDKQLDLDDVNPGSYKGLIVFDRWSGITPGNELNDDLDSPVDFGLPKFYTVKGQNGDSFEVHSSRILRFTGPEVPNPEFQASMMWGISVLEVAYEEIRKRDNLSWAILQLMFRAQILTMVNPNLASLISGVGASGQAATLAATQLQAQNELMSNQSLLVLPKDGSLQSHQYTFGGVSEIYQQFQMDISGAADYTVTRLFGRTATGLSQGNDADERIYEEKIAQHQNDEVRPQLDKLYPIIAMSEWGEVPDDLDFTFPSIRVLTEKEKAELAKDGSEAILAFYNGGVISQKTALLELKQQSDVTGIGTNVTDADIKAANDQVIDPMEVAAAGAKDDSIGGGGFDDEG